MRISVLLVVVAAGAVMAAPEDNGPRKGFSWSSFLSLPGWARKGQPKAQSTDTSQPPSYAVSPDVVIKRALGKHLIDKHYSVTNENAMTYRIMDTRVQPSLFNIRGDTCDQIVKPYMQEIGKFRTLIVAAMRSPKSLLGRFMQSLRSAKHAITRASSQLATLDEKNVANAFTAMFNSVQLVKVGSNQATGSLVCHMETKTYSAGPKAGLNGLHLYGECENENSIVDNKALGSENIHQCRSWLSLNHGNPLPLGQVPVSTQQPMQSVQTPLMKNDQSQPMPLLRTPSMTSTTGQV